LTYVRQYSFLQPAADGESLLIIWCTVPFSFQPPWHLYAAQQSKRCSTNYYRVISLTVTENICHLHSYFIDFLTRSRIACALRSHGHAYIYVYKRIAFKK
jgi:hypothetical protein